MKHLKDAVAKLAGNVETLLFRPKYRVVREYLNNDAPCYFIERRQAFRWGTISGYQGYRDVAVAVRICKALMNPKPNKKTVVFP